MGIRYKETTGSAGFPAPHPNLLDKAKGVVFVVVKFVRVIFSVNASEIGSGSVIVVVVVVAVVVVAVVAAAVAAANGGGGVFSQVRLKYDLDKNVHVGSQ